jgi:hypothetical protein
MNELFVFTCKILIDKTKGDIGLDGRITLKLILKKQDEKLRANIWLGTGTSGRLL